MNTPQDPMGCPKCGKCLPARDVPCTLCGAAALLRESSGELDIPMIREYRVLRLCGMVVLVAGILAVLADSRFAAGVALTIGTAIYLVGLLGTWWNRRN